MLLREDQFMIKAFVPNVSFPGTWSWTSLEGGDVQADDTFTRPGGMLPGLNLGGPAKRSDVTIKRQYSTDLHPYIIALEQQAGIASGMVVAWQPLDANDNVSGGNSAGGFVHLTGVLKEVQHPNMDANANAVGWLTLVMGADVEAKPGVGF